MKNFLLLTAVAVYLFILPNKAISQCDVDPTISDINIQDVTVDFINDGFCTGIDEFVSDLLTGTLDPADITPGDASPDCDHLDPAIDFSINFTDVWSGGCPEVITRTWEFFYDNGSGTATWDQMITIEDNTDPIPILDDTDYAVTITDACDETDSEVESISGFAFSTGPEIVDEADFPGDPGEDCTVLEISYEDTYVTEDCLATGFIGTITRTWTVTDLCDNTGTAIQMITLTDDVDPVIVLDDSNFDILISDACDETDSGVETTSGFPFSDTETGVNDVDFPGSITELCSVNFNGTDDQVSYVDVYTADGCPSNVGIITRTWMVTDQCGNMATADQTITIMDMEAPTIDICPAPVTVELLDACDESDSNVETITGLPYSDALTPITEADFTLAGGAASDLCIDDGSIMVFYVDTPVDVMPDMCPTGFISFTRTFSLEDDCGNISTDLCEQVITLIDMMDPVFDVELPDFDDSAQLIACDENDQNIAVETGFPFDDGPVTVSEADYIGAGGMVSDNCNPTWQTELEITYSDVFTAIADNCPDEVGELIRTWTVTDHCGNSVDYDQTILIYDLIGPTIDACPVDVQIPILYPDNCDENNADIEAETGFAFSNGPTVIDGLDFPGSAIDNCNGGAILEAEYSDIILGTGCTTGANIAMDIERTWVVTDLCGNTSSCTHAIQLMDNEEPMFDAFPDFFYDQGPQGMDGGGEWTIESIFCNAEVDFTSEFMLPGMADIVDNCTDFGNLQITYNPDISAGPLAIPEGTTSIMMTITDECNNRYEEAFEISLVCVPCGPDDIFPTCDDPPTICDLNDIVGFTSCTPEYLGSVIEPLCAGFVVNNPSYFEFIAGAEDLDLSVLPSNCSNGAGVQAAVIDPCVPTACYTDVGGACFTTETTVTATGLTVGNVYQLIVDGCGGDECNWTITNITATAFSIPDPEPEEQIVELPQFTGCDVDDLIFCQGSTIAFWPENFDEALYFFCWNIDNMNGVTAVNGDEDCTEFTALETLGEVYECPSDFSSCGPIELQFEELGTYTLCLVELENGCDTETPADYCWEIQIVANGPVDFGEWSVCQHDLEAGWFPDVEGPNGEQWAGETIFGEGDYNNFVQVDCGGEFEHIIVVNLLPEEIETVEVLVFADDIQSYTNPGLGIDWNDVEEYYEEPFGSNPFAFFNPLEEESEQIGYNNIACDTFFYLDFFIFDVPGNILQVPGPACDIILSLELGDEFPDNLIDEDELFYFWYFDGNVEGTESTISVTADNAGDWELIVEYTTDNGDQCSFLFEELVTDFPSMAADPTWQAAPTETCITELDGIVFSVPITVDATYNWNVSGATFTENAEGNEITISILDPNVGADVCISLVSQCGTSAEICEQIMITDPPTVNLLPVMDVCINQAVTIATNTTGTIDEYFWNIPDGNFTMTGLNMASSVDVSWPAPGTYTITVSVEDAAGCTSNVTELEVNVVPELVPPNFTCTLENSNSVEISFSDAVVGEGTTYFVTTGQTAEENNGVLTFTGLTTDEQVTVVFTTLSGAYPCPDVSGTITCTATNCPLNPQIEQPNEICLDGSEAPFQLEETAGNPGGTWDGPGTDAAGMFDPAVAGAGTHLITYEVSDVAADCTASANVTIVVYPNPVEDISLSIDTVCINEELIVDFANTPGLTYSFAFGQDSNDPATDTPGFGLSYSVPGTQFITYTISSGPDCDYTASEMVYVEPAGTFPEPYCIEQTLTSVTMGWDLVDGIIDYDWELLVNGEAYDSGTQSTNEVTATGLSVGDEVTLFVEGFDGCSVLMNTFICEAEECPTFMVQADADITATCFEPGIEINLSALVEDENGAMPAGAGVWTGPTDPNIFDADNGIFTPIASSPTPYLFSYTYTIDGTTCQETASIEVNIFDSPIADFSQDLEEICITDPTVVFTLENAAYSSDVTYTWTSTGDWVEGDNYTYVDEGDGDFTFTFTEQGTGTFSLMTAIGSCESMDLTTLSVSVELEPTLPTIICAEEDLDYVLFSWNEVNCAVAYDVYIDGNLVEEDYTDTEYEVTGLDQNDVVDIELVVISDCLCDFPETVTQTCTAQDCAPATVDIDASTFDALYCISDAPSFTITADVTGAEIDNSGAFTWSGDGVDADGNVDLTALGAGTYTIDVEYAENGCFYFSSADITIVDEPSIDVTTVNAPCPGSLGQMTITGTGGDGNYTFSTDNETFDAGVNDIIAGDYTVTVTDGNLCTAELSFTVGTDAAPAQSMVSSIDPNQMILLNESASYTFSADADIENVTWSINGEVVSDVDCAAADCLNYNFSSEESGTFEICVSATYDGGNCVLTECREIVVDQIVIPGIYIPNVITPEEETDPTNQTLNMYVHGQAVKVLSVGIFDKWGNRVYFSEEEIVVNDGEFGVLWDGTFPQGNDFLAGVYVYLIETEINGVVEYETDDVTIVR